MQPLRDPTIWASRAEVAGVVATLECPVSVVTRYAINGRTGSVILQGPPPLKIRIPRMGTEAK